MVKKNNGEKAEKEVSLVIATEKSKTSIIERSFIKDPISRVTREIDGKSGTLKDITYVEVRDRKGHQSIDCIDQIRGKYRDIPNAGIYVASFGGFTRDAIKHAMPDYDMNLLELLLKDGEKTTIQKDRIAHLVTNHQHQ